MSKKLIHFLQEDLEIPSESIDMVMRRHSLTPIQVPIILWQYGLITREQLELIFDWIDTAQLTENIQSGEQFMLRH